MSEQNNKTFNTSEQRLQEMGEFKRILQQRRVDMGWTKSDLAREIWGERTDPRGVKVARNRDNIGKWESGSTEPEEHNLTKLAAVLGLSVEVLAPDILARKMQTDDTPAIQMTMIPGYEDKVHVFMNVIADPELAGRLIGMATRGGVQTVGSLPVAGHLKKVKMEPVAGKEPETKSAKKSEKADK